MSRVHMKAASDRINKVKAQRIRLQQARRAALADLGCESCGMSKDDLRTEQSRLRREFYDRQAVRQEMAA